MNRLRCKDRNDQLFGPEDQRSRSHGGLEAGEASFSTSSVGRFPSFQLIKPSSSGAVLDENVLWEYRKRTRNSAVAQKPRVLRVIKYFTKSLKVIENGTIRKLWYGFLFAFYSITTASCIVSAI